MSNHLDHTVSPRFASAIRAACAARLASLVAGLCMAVAVLQLGGCAAPALQADMSDAQYQQVLAADFPPGMTLDQVKDELKTLHVSQDFAHLYPPSADGSQVYLVRTYPPTGPWPQFGPDSNVEFVDVSFVFGPGGALQRSLIYRDGLRYGNGQVMYGPNRAGLEPQGKWMTGPPADPLQGAY